MKPCTARPNFWAFPPILCNRNGPDLRWYMMVFFIGAAITVLFGSDLLSAIRLPGNDVSDKLTAAGTLLRIVDTGLFKWGARIFAGLCLMSGGWALKEQKYGIFIICIVGSIIFGTIPSWVKNIFDIGGNKTLFSMLDSLYNYRYYLKA